ncbi:dienelactone hydrolase family protein [Methanosarcina sp.]|uniref:dienelactone hydrolase family protein n=1 Tax=Methanosarcina sp. TaxID=2213 RepID=UPI003C723233
MNKLVLFLLIVSLLGALGSTASSYSDSEAPEAAGTACNETESQCLASSQNTGLETTNCSAPVEAKTVNITSNCKVYPAYTAAPAEEGNYPAIVLIHSFRGFEPGYQIMVDRMAEDGYVVIAPFWQTYSDSPSDAEVEALIRNSTVYLETRDDVDSERLGLTGFCAGGRYTMLFLPQIEKFESGVAWYGFPYMGGSETQPDRPASLIDQLDTPMLIIHGTRDQYSNITDIYRYVGELDAADKYFEMKVYQGEPHGFMITEDGELSESFVAQDAYEGMITFFDRTLNSSAL